MLALVTSQCLRHLQVGTSQVGTARVGTAQAGTARVGPLAFCPGIVDEPRHSSLFMILPFYDVKHAPWMCSVHVPKVDSFIVGHEYIFASTNGAFASLSVP